MNIEIKNFLQGQDTPDNIDFYENISNLLVSLGQTDFATVVDEMMMITGTSNIGSFVDKYRQLLSDTVEEVIEEHGLFVNEDAPLRDKVLLLEFFLQIEKTELIEQVDNLLASDETNNIELFAEVVAAVISCDVENIMLTMAMVPDAVLKNMRAYISLRCEMEIAMESIDSPEMRLQFKTLEQYCRLMKAQKTVGYTLAFQEGGRVGDRMIDMFNMHLSSMNRTSIPAFVKELMAMAICSDGWKNPMIAIDQAISLVTEDLRELSEIRAAIEVEFNAWQFNVKKDNNNVKE